MANSGQRCRWFCVGGADGSLFAAVFHRAVDMEFVDMNPIDNDDDDDTQVYKRPWVNLTDDEIEVCFDLVDDDGFGLFDLSRAIEAKLREKNA